MNFILMWKYFMIQVMLEYRTVYAYKLKHVFNYVRIYVPKKDSRNYKIPDEWKHNNKLQ